MSETMSVPTTAIAPFPRPARELFLVSLAILFTELCFIRWFGSTVVFLTYFTNIVLLASFLGMSVGCLAASSRRDFTSMVVPIAFLAVVLSVLAFEAHGASRVKLKIGDQAAPQQIYFGAEQRMVGRASLELPIEFGAAFFFTVIALCFVGLGQHLGRAFDAIPNRIAAYSINILGSLVGIGLFGLLSARQTPPVVWFAIAVGLGLAFGTKYRRLQIVAGMALLIVVFQWSTTTKNSAGKPWNLVFWSPYYKIAFDPETKFIATNNISHQQMVDVKTSGPAYSLPYLLNRDSGNAPIRDVLIIGAGSGNDVLAALDLGAEHVDAVEIDPVIRDLGRIYHPRHPYNDPRVHYHNDDGRSFLRRTDRKYDLVVYALVDSLVLHSGYSSVRLESFLFTEQAFREVGGVLKPDGLFIMYNYYRKGWVAGRLVELATREIGPNPLVLPMPALSTIDAETDLAANITGILAGPQGSNRLEAIRAKLANGSFWLNASPGVNAEINGFEAEPPADDPVERDKWSKIAPAVVDTTNIGPLPTDEWPFLYLRAPTIPGLNLRGIALLAGLSLVILQLIAPINIARPQGRMFFLGAGFMLLETKGVVHMALLFGSTWAVNSFVFAAILVMILAANLFVAVVKPDRIGWAYLALGLALLLNALVPIHTFLTLGMPWRVIVSCLVVFLPVFFAGVVFARIFRDAERPDLALGWNVVGAIVGGLAENLSLILGFDHILFVAMAFYAISAGIDFRRSRSASPILSGSGGMSDAMPSLLGIEIGGTKLQIGFGRGDGRIIDLVRLDVDRVRGASGIRDQIAEATTRLQDQHGAIDALGIGFGGPIDRKRRRTIKSHQIDGWDDFPLADWAVSTLGISRVDIHNDADTAALGEARFGAGVGKSPVLYITIGSGIGGGLVIDGRIYRGNGAGAVEIGHLRMDDDGAPTTLEDLASGWGITPRGVALA